MTTQIEVLEGLERRLSMSVPTADIQTETRQRLAKLARTVRMPGFRPGKVPMKMVEQSYGPQVSAEVLGDAVSRAFSSAVAEHKLRVAGEPRIEPSAGDDAPADAFRFTATFEVYPEVTLNPVAGVALERFESPVGDAEIDRTIEILRKQRVTWAPADRAAQDGDRVKIDFKGTLDGVAFPGGTAEGFPFVLGEGRMLADFETGVRGAAKGEARTFDVAFPADYGNAELAGKTAQFEVTVHEIEAPVLPELDAEFARLLGVEDGDLDKMRADVRANLEREVGQRLRAKTKAGVMEKLPELATLDVPRALVESEAARMVEQTQAELKQRGIDTSKIPVPPDAFREQAEKRVRLGLILAELVKQNQLQAKPDQIRKQIEEFAQAYENPGELIRWYYSDRSRLADIEAVVVEQNVVDWLLANGTTTEKTIGFEELMNAAN